MLGLEGTPPARGTALGLVNTQGERAGGREGAALALVEEEDCRPD